MLVIAILIGQGLIAIALLLIVHTFGVYTEQLRKTHQENLQIRQNLAEQQNDIAVREALRRSTIDEEKVS
jgi:Tfp pilus assembly protein PilO